MIAFFISNIFLPTIIGMMNRKNCHSRHQTFGWIYSDVWLSGVYWIFLLLQRASLYISLPHTAAVRSFADQDSIVIAYDNVRGEPRGKLKKNEPKDNLGDCIDCYLCVDVCPTGIDIRNGIQLECVNCTACIDACDAVMDKIDRPRGLIRYDSLRGIERKEKFRFTPRMALYSSILVLLISVLSYLLITRSDFSINILRTPGLLYQEQPGSRFSNIYDLNIINKTFVSAPIQLKLMDIDGELKLLGDEINLTS
jgi:cytochrome c oxidase accessory protein FixG